MCTQRIGTTEGRDIPGMNVVPIISFAVVHNFCDLCNGMPPFPLPMSIPLCPIEGMVAPLLILLVLLSATMAENPLLVGNPLIVPHRANR